MEAPHTASSAQPLELHTPAAAETDEPLSADPADWPSHLIDIYIQTGDKLKEKPCRCFHIGQEGPECFDVYQTDVNHVPWPPHLNATEHPLDISAVC